MSASTRRAALGAILAAPLASVPVVASAPVSPELARLIVKHDRINAILDAECDGERFASEDTCRAAGLARARVAGFRSQGLPDILAKAACLARLYPLADMELEVREEVETGHANLDCMAHNIAAELMRFGEGTLCA